ncbi:hypothetical protein F4561_000956 [Lipingzhangella halophila]|uniref:Uncharacterized protein n=1 Tax=Lipingzhangella halophila TaxID=1783352 RepID=A0A7W7W102_9ACTN|nr:hypothetical protein [Lipingzhangella halophila]
MSFSLSGVPQALVAVGTVLVIAMEPGMVIALWAPLLRPYAIISGILIHLSFIPTMQPLPCSIQWSAECRALSPVRLLAPSD